MRKRVMLFLLFLACGTAWASDGVLEINQTCAEGPGCFPGDDAGFPVRLANSGSYILTSNLVVPALLTGITTATAPATFPATISVSIDLNGFRISSTTTCTGSPPVCSPTTVGEGAGITIIATENAIGHIRNGTIQGMANSGATCGGRCTVSDLTVSNNGRVGLAAGGLIRSVYAYRNGIVGIGGIGENTTITGCISNDNGESGYWVGAGVFTNNFAEENADFGILSDASGSTLIGNRITAPEGSVGISCRFCAVHNNTIRGSGGAVDFDDTDSIYGGNVFGNAAGLLNAGEAIQSAPNVCGTAACP